MWRLVTGRVYKTNDVPWVNSTVVFRRVRGNYTSDTQYPPDIVKAYTNSNGILNKDTVGADVGVKLWVDTTGNLSSTYECILPNNDKFIFTIPVGDGSAIALSTLRAINNPIENHELISSSFSQKKAIAFNSASLISLFSLPANAENINFRINLATAFNGNPSLSIGVTGNTSKYFAANEIDLALGSDIYFDNVYTGKDILPQNVIATYSAGGATVGELVIYTSYSLFD
jgi:hypothetical protein